MAEYPIKVLTVLVLAPTDTSDELGKALYEKMEDLGERLHGAALEYVAARTTPEEKLRVEVRP